VGFVHADGGFHSVHDMPIQMTTTGRRAVDFAALAEILREHKPAFTLVERVGSRPNEGAVGAFSFGMSYGGIIAVLAVLALPHGVIQPATWKRRAGIPAGAPKGVSVAVCKQVLPTTASRLTRIKDDGRAESLLLALQSRARSFSPTEGVTP